MDKNAIKRYAVWARRELISRVSQKALQYGITDKDIIPATATSVNGVVLSAEEMKQRKALIERINAKGYEQVMEEVAYTWFNRFIALRFMEVNGYLPSRVRVFTDENNTFNPQILTEAISLEMDGLDMEKVYAFKDANDDDGLYKYLLIVQCNALNPILSGMFQRIFDYTELLFPDNLLRDGSVIEQMITMIPEDDWKDAVQIIGWLYQYYNSEKKDDVFAALKKNVKITKENIPAATQLFTPDWIVRYMVENSLGRLWLEHLAASGEGYHYCYDEHGNNVASSVVTSTTIQQLKSNWKYYLDEADQEPDVQAQLAEIRRGYVDLTPEQIKVIDPCCGSGHILAYMFDVLVQIYEVYGYSVREAVRSIVENNIYGLDIDDRAAQLAYFAVMMKARQYDRRFLTRKDEDDNPDVPQPHVYAIVESNHLDQYAVEYFVGGDAKLKAALSTIINELHDAKEYGSILDVTPQDWSALYRRFDEIVGDIDLSREVALRELLPLVQVAEALAQKYDVVVTNPPYMSNKGMSNNLLSYIQKNYPDGKADLFAVFIEKCKSELKPNGLQAMITQHSWMFLSSYEKLRMKLRTSDIVNMAHLGPRAFEEIGGEVVQTTAFVYHNIHVVGYKSVYCRLVEPTTQDSKEELFLSGKEQYCVAREQFECIAGSPFAYWASEQALSNFEIAKPLIEYSRPRVGQNTGDNDRFLRFWHETEIQKIGFGVKHDELASAEYKWIPYNKGGSFRRWYGNFDRVVNWQNDGQEIKDYAVIRNHGKHWSRYIQNIENMCREGVSWSDIASTRFACRYLPEGFICDVKGSSTYPSEKYRTYVMAFLNSCVAIYYLQMLNPTTTFQVGNIGSLPFIFKCEKLVNGLALENVTLSKLDWDSDETSWDFQSHPLIAMIPKGGACFEVGRILLSECYELWEGECDERFNQLKSNEEELNRIFIDIYGLQNELTPEVEDKDVTVRKADLGRDIRSFIAYAVGCMFGRYSLDEPGLAYAGGAWVADKYKTFPADKDNIIPICDDEYFEDDIVGRFVEFVKTVYGADTLDENLKFIADALGGKSQPREVIRSYFMNDFFNDHCRIYQKRPIYWLFDSGKKGGFRALIYMHRYQPDTIARMRTDYVHEQQARYRTAIADLEQRIASASTSERVKLNKRLKTLQDQAAEIQGYEEKIHHLADQYISIDLDDGVKKNYEIFKDVLAKIK